MNILMLSSEIYPFVKTGGMADVLGALPAALKPLGADVRLAMPRYGLIPAERFHLEPRLPAFDVPLDGTPDQASIWQSTLPGDVPVYFIDNPRLYQRDGIYLFPDDAERFIFFCRAALEMCRRLEWRPDVVHCHDWQTAIVPNWLKTIYADDPFFRNTASVYTIHNLAYKGLFGTRVLEIAGLPPKDFVAGPELMSDPNYPVDFMARGIYYADVITTGSERYAREIQTPEFGQGLDAVLRSRRDRLAGIQNGIDAQRLDPATDPHLVQHYAAGAPEARGANKAALQRELGLRPDAGRPLLGVVSRLNDQKGMYLLRDVSEHILALGAQLAVIGTGDDALRSYFADLQRRYPEQAAYRATFAEHLAARLFAGSDIYLMPSRFEAAGTNQMIALRYGAVPVVRRTGGLADTVRDFDPRSGEGNGFTFEAFDGWQFFAAVVRAVETFRHEDAWRRVQRNGMTADLSWAPAAPRYLDAYRTAVEIRQREQAQRQSLATDMADTARMMATLPARIARLNVLAYNLWWTWQPEARALFAQLDPARWDATNHNPVKLLRETPPERLAACAADAAFTERYDRVLGAFDAYMGARDTWHARTAPGDGGSVAYLSFEFGLHESLPIYSGGLGILAGDTCKEASDLGLPFVAVGFLYPQGFFHQQIDAQGNQIALEQKVNFAESPAEPVIDAAGKHVTIAVELPGRAIHAQLWRIRVGRIALIMMDTDIAQNSPSDRALVAQLYHGDQETRIAQEMIFGIGAVRALRAAGIAPRLWHLNEGHGAFLCLELLRELAERGVQGDEAVARVRAQTLFTTHTPVPAGNDAFAPELMDKYFGHFYPQLGLSRDTFLNLAAHDGRFSMTVLALRLSGGANGVSQLHGAVSRGLWGWIWPGTPAERVPIGSITNGVHTETWLAPEIGALFARALGPDWHDRLDEPGLWDAIASVPDEDLWRVHSERRAKLIALAGNLARARLERLGLPGEPPALDPNILTLGFARRFATYKRATLIFRDVERLRRILHDPARPVQILFAGKAHPADQPGQDLIREVYRHAQEEGLRPRLHFLEEYDMHSARYLVAGVDVWLNNPRRPMEASGTSGMKAALNGVPTASVLDGWWVEGYNGTNGWAIGASPAGAQAAAGDEARQDAADAEALYRTLEEQVVPLYYRRDERGIPREWVRVMKEAIRTLAPRFSTRRMLKEYAAWWRDRMA